MLLDLSLFILAHSTLILGISVFMELVVLPFNFVGLGNRRICLPAFLISLVFLLFVLALRALLQV